MPKIIILDGETVFDKENSSLMPENSGEVVLYANTPSNMIAERIGDGEIVVTNKCVIDKNIIDSCPNLKYISVLATGFNVVDVKYAEKKNIKVSNVPAYSTESVVQHTFALILELCNSVSEYNISTHRKEWCEKTFFTYELSPIYELKNKVIGIVGYGNIGKRIAEVAKIFGMKTLYFRKNPDGISVDLDYLLANSDIVTLHCPLTPDNNKLINRDALSKMKKSAFLINTSRGGVIDENDLKDALENSVIAGAALDVLSKEPPERDNPLLTCKNCIITPHVAWASRESKERLRAVTAENIMAFLNGNHINRVNFLN